MTYTKDEAEEMCQNCVNWWDGTCKVFIDPAREWSRDPDKGCRCYEEEGE